MTLPDTALNTSPNSSIDANTKTKSNSAEQYYERHIFFCLNERDAGKEACANHRAQEGFDRCKSQVKAAGLSAPGKVRVNKAGCLDRCAAGPVAVVYPEAVWYTYVDAQDIDEIVESHLKNGKVVERLLTSVGLGR
jgi:(2Fe-2S) ferredoxin